MSTLASIEVILERGGDADDVLRGVVRVLGERFDYAAIMFVEGDELVPGPSSGTPDQSPARAPITFQGMKVGELGVSPARAEDREFLERVATSVAPYCLVGWDTGGERWSP
ncbi:MAG: hypothetical protein ABI896_08065 [Actinomycetota bacterium]